MAQDYYQTLGVERDAGAEEIRKANRKLARKHHPDLNPGDKAAEDRFKKVQEAYDILSDPKKKQMYDQYGFYSENGFAGAGGPNAGGQGPPPGMDFGGFDFSDVSRITQQFFEFPRNRRHLAGIVDHCHAKGGIGHERIERQQTQHCFDHARGVGRIHSYQPLRVRCRRNA